MLGESCFSSNVEVVGIGLAMSWLIDRHTDHSANGAVLVIKSHKTLIECTLQKLT